MLPHDHGGPQLGRSGGIGILVAIGGGGIGHQDCRGAGHRQFAQGAGATAADHQVGVLQQAGDLVAEGPLHHAGRQRLARLGVVAAGEVHHPHPGRREPGQQGPQHAVEAEGPLAAAHHQQQGARPQGGPGRQGGGFQEGLAHGGARDDRPAAGQAGGGLGQADGHPAAEPAQQAGHLAGHGIALVQHHRHAAPAGRQDGRSGDVAATGEHRLDALPADHAPHGTTGPQQLHQVPEFAQAPALEPAGPHRLEWIAAGHQLAFHPVGHAQPLDAPVRRHRIGHRQGWEQVAAGAAGSDQEPGHGCEGSRARLT